MKKREGGKREKIGGVIRHLDLSGGFVSSLFLGHLVLFGQTQLCRGCHLSVGSVSLGMKNLPGMGNKFRPGQKSLAESESLGDSTEDPLPSSAAEKMLQHSGPLPCLSGLRKGVCLNLTLKGKQIV